MTLLTEQDKMLIWLNDTDVEVKDLKQREKIAKEMARIKADNSGYWSRRLMLCLYEVAIFSSGINPGKEP